MICSENAEEEVGNFIYSIPQPESGKDFDPEVLTLLWKPNHKPVPKPSNTLEDPKIKVD
jgi:hypothetical protein